MVVVVDLKKKKFEMSKFRGGAGVCFFFFFLKGREFLIYYEFEKRNGRVEKLQR